MQKFTIEEVRNNEFSNIVEQIHRVVGQKSTSSKIDYKDIFFWHGYDNRDVIVSNENDTLNIYIGTRERYNNCVLITAKKKILQISRAVYRRMGNGTVQEGVIASYIYDSNNEYDRYVQLELHNSSERQAQVDFFQAYGKIPTSILGSFLVDPHTLEIFDENGNRSWCLYFAMPEINQMLSLLKRSYIKGENEINGVLETHEDEDLTNLGSVELNFGGKAIVLNNQKK